MPELLKYSLSTQYKSLTNYCNRIIYTNKNNMITLNKEKETLLVPLYGKVMETQKKTPILYDAKAVEIIEKIDYDFKSLKIPGKTNTMMCLRAKKTFI